MNERSIKILQSLNSVEVLLDNVKAEFQAHMRDKSVPLDERWEIFKKAPEYLGSHDGFMASFKSISDEDDWFADIERYRTVDNRDLVEDFEYDLKNHDESFTRPHDWLSEQLIIDLKEEILADCFMTWVMDW